MSVTDRPLDDYTLTFLDSFPVNNALQLLTQIPDAEIVVGRWSVPPFGANFLLDVYFANSPPTRIAPLAKKK